MVIHNIATSIYRYYLSVNITYIIGPITYNYVCIIIIFTVRIWIIIYHSKHLLSKCLLNFNIYYKMIVSYRDSIIREIGLYNK